MVKWRLLAGAFSLAVDPKAFKQGNRSPGFTAKSQNRASTRWQRLTTSTNRANYRKNSPSSWL